MMGSKWVDHWTSNMELCVNIVRLQAIHRAPPPSVGCEAGRMTCSERETGTEELCEIKWDYHIVSITA
jgi:hypothetical protein